MVVNKPQPVAEHRAESSPHPLGWNLRKRMETCEFEEVLLSNKRGEGKLTSGVVGCILNATCMYPISRHHVEFSAKNFRLSGWFYRACAPGVTVTESPRANRANAGQIARRTAVFGDPLAAPWGGGIFLAILEALGKLDVVWRPCG